MAFVVQTDDGTTSGANAYVDLTYFKAYHDAAGNDYSAFTDPQVQNGIVRGTRYVDTHFQYKGIKLLPPTTPAEGTLIATQNFANTETVTIGTKVYTFQTSLTNVDGNVAIGVDLATSLINLANAIDGAGAPGVDYAAAMAANTNVTADQTATTLTVTASKNGFAGNALASTTTGAHASWGAATLSGGIGPQTTQWPRQAGNAIMIPWFDINFLTPQVDTQVGPQGFVSLVDSSGNNLNGIPDAIKDACSEYALRALNILLWQDAPAPPGGRLIHSISQSVDVIRQDITYEPGQAGAFAMPAFPAADMILARAGIIEVGRTRSGDAMAALPQLGSSAGFFDFVSLRRNAIDLINQDGQPVNVIRTVEAAAQDPSLPWRRTPGTSSQTFYPCQAVISPVRLRASRSGAAPPESYKTILLPGDVGATTKYGTDGITVVQTDRVQLQIGGLIYTFVSSPDPQSCQPGIVICWTGYAHPLPDDTGGI